MTTIDHLFIDYVGISIQIKGLPECELRTRLKREKHKISKQMKKIDKERAIMLLRKGNKKYEPKTN